MALRDKIPFFAGLSLPMLGLMALAVFRALREPFDPQIWSIIASKYIVPFALFHIAVLVFRGASQRKHFEIFVILALAYLVFIAIAFLADARSLIFPRFILDESLGFHPDRARGPFLQAVANGVSLNILGILVIALSQKRKTVVGLLWLALPLAVLATMTRAVWISFAVSTIVLGFRLIERRLQAACILLAVAGFLVGLAISLSDHSLKAALWDRTGERGPVERAWPCMTPAGRCFRSGRSPGWPAGGMYAELARRMEGYHLRTFYVHNTYLALLVEFGVPGLALYGILFFNLFRLAWRGPPGESGPVAALRKVWPILLERLSLQRLLRRHGVPVRHWTRVHRCRDALRVRGVRRMTTIAYIANEFPSPLEPYVIDEITELRRRGARVICCSGKRVSPNNLSLAERAFWKETRFFQPLSDDELVRAARRLASDRHNLWQLLRPLLWERGASPVRRIRALGHTVMGAALAEQLAPLDVEHIHAHHGYFASWMALAAARLLGIGFSFTLHGSDLLQRARSALGQAARLPVLRNGLRLQPPVHSPQLPFHARGENHRATPWGRSRAPLAHTRRRSRGGSRSATAVLSAFSPSDACIE